MKVSELIELLQHAPQDATVVIAKDGEGNVYSPFENWSVGNYAPETRWSGEFGLRELDEDAKDAGFTEEDIIEGELAVCLWPMN